MEGFMSNYKALLFVPLIILVSSAFADVSPPLVARIEGFVNTFSSTDSSFEVRVAVMVPRYGKNSESRITLTLTADGAVRISGQSSWTLDRFELDKPQEFTSRVSLTGYGTGTVKLQAKTFDAGGRALWGAADYLFVLSSPEDFLLGKSSLFELKQEKLRREGLSPSEYDKQMRDLLEGRELPFELRMRGLPLELQQLEQAPSLAAVATATVTGRASYTHRTGQAGGSNVFASSANARGIPAATVEFYDQNGVTETKLTTSPATVVTNASGNYTATIPGARGDGTAVNLVVKVKAESRGARIGPSGIGANPALVHTKASAASTVNATPMTVNIVVDNSTPNLLEAFSIHEGILTAYDFVVGNNSRTGVGVAPSLIYIEFPGLNPNGSFFSTANGDHLNIGQGHAFDWDVYTHEYGHYVQKINGTTQNPGGAHNICANATGSGTPARTKDQGIKLAWGEGWPTFFGTNLQIASGAGAFGIYGVGDTVYTDTGNGFHYDLEGNADLCAGAGEDSELSVQRLLWDFADQPQDGHDEVTFGTDEMWRQLNSAPKPVTLDQFRAKFNGLTPSSPAFYSTGTLAQNQVKYGRVYFDHNIGPEPLEPGENFSSATPPKFKWLTKGAGGAPSYHFNKFNVLFYNKDYSSVVFTSPEIPTNAGTLAPDGTTAEWTPSTTQWNTILAGDKLLHWVVQGSNDTLAPTTGPYLGLDRTIGGLSIVFVIDDTGSMSEEIGGVRLGLTSFINTLRGMALATTPLIEVITFKDNVTRRIVSQDIDQIQSVVNSLVATGGGDCPESSAEALLEALNDLPRGSGGKIIFATDASPHAGFSLAGVKAKIREKGIGITELVTGDCNAAGGVFAAATRTLSSTASIVSSDNKDLNYRAPVPEPGVVWPSDVICPDCPLDDIVGPFMSPNILKLVGDSSLTTPSSVASWAEIATASPKGQILFLPGTNTGDTTPFVNAVANSALGAVVPTVIGVQPVDGYQGATMDVMVIGGNTNFNSTSTVSFGSGIVVNHVDAISPTGLKANITVGPSAPLGFRDITVLTSLGATTTESTAGKGQFRINSAGVTPRITSVSPSTVGQNSDVTLLISGLNTHFNSATTVTVSGVITKRIVTRGPTSLEVDLSVPNNATLGFHLITATTGSETVVLDNTLTLVSSLGPDSTVPVISSVTPAGAAQGASNFNVEVIGTNTHFVNGVSVVSFSGTGVTVNNTTVTSPTVARANISIAPNAPLGFRDVVVTTGGEVAAALGAFSVSFTPIPSLSINDVSVNEGQIGTTNAVFTVTISAASTQTVTVNFSTANGTATAGSDYVAQSGVLTFTPGQTSKTITVLVNGDTVVEPNETFFVNLTSATNATIADSQGMGTIVNDDTERLGNISTRGRVLSGDNVMIGGFIIDGSAPLRVLVRSRGPSISGAPFFLPGTLANPLVRLFSGSTEIARNDNWQDTPNCPGFVCEGAAAITATGLDPCQPNPGQPGAPPNCNLESAILITLPPGAYTGIVTGADGGTGVGLVEVFEADTSSTSDLSNISTRGFVQSGDNVMIGGLIIEGNAPATLLIRARGPSMGGAPFNLPATLANPFIQLFSGQTVIAQNDNWQVTDPLCLAPAVTCGGVAAIVATGLDPCQPNPGQTTTPPGCTLESALLITLPPGAYTAIVSGVGGGTGVGIVEVFEVN
jgi:hypothetical protein